MPSGLARALREPGRPSRPTRAALKASAATRVRDRPRSFAQTPTEPTRPAPNSRRCGRRISTGQSRSLMAVSWTSWWSGCDGGGAVGGEPLGVLDRFDEAALAGDALAGDVEGG